MSSQPRANALEVRLIALTDTAAYPDYLEHAEELCRAALPGSVAIVLRDRDCSVRQRLAAGRALRRFTQEFGQELWVSDRVDLARVLDADGVHLPADGLAPRACRRIWTGRISRSSHGLERLERGDWQTLDALLISPVFAPRKGREALGAVGLVERCRWIQQRAPRVRTFALGGVEAENARLASASGAWGVAAIGAVWELSSRRELLRALGIVL